MLAPGIVSAGRAPAVTVQLGPPKILTHSGAGGTTTTLIELPGFSSVAGKILVRTFGRCNKAGGSFAAPTQKFGSSTFTNRRFNGPATAAQGRPFVLIGTMLAGPTGAHDFQSAGDPHGELVVMLNDILNWTGDVGAVGGQAAQVAAMNTVTASLTKNVAGGLVAGLAGMVHGGGVPWRVDGWAKDGEDSTGPAEGNDASAVFASREGGALGATETLTAVGSVATDDLGAAVIELY